MTFLWVANGLSQNLIKNPSFEEFVNCPKTLGNFEVDLNYWNTPTEGSTDYFNGCSTAMGTPKNFNGTQPADFGVGYAGLYLYAPNDYREYIQAELTETLIKDKKYRISFYVSLAERSDFAIKEFGVLFCKQQLHIPTKKELSKKLLYQEKDNAFHSMEIGYSNFYSDTQDWILVHAEFIAKGTEKFMILGNFKSNDRTRMFMTKKNAKQGAYYYIDMVLVEDMEMATKTLAQQTEGDLAYKTDFQLDKINTFQNVLFDFDESVLLENAQRELEAIHIYFINHPGLKIHISGHTDDVGNESYNQKLSAARAAAVASRLIKLGVSKELISWKGFGSRQPISSNDTEAGRQMNRRVEFLMTKEP